MIVIAILTAILDNTFGTDMKPHVKIGLLFGFGRAYGRRLCTGVASVALAREWELALFSLEDVEKGNAVADAFIARELDAKTVMSLKALGKPVVNIYSDDPGSGFSTVDCDHVAVGRLAAEHFLEHRFRNFAFCGYEGTVFSDRRGDAFAQKSLSIIGMEGLSPSGGGRDRRLSNGVVIGSRGFVERMGEALSARFWPGRRRILAFSHGGTDLFSTHGQRSEPKAS